jgi:membrane-bound ClpP family serine protease
MTLFYAVCLIAGLLFTLISAVAGHVFHGGDGHSLGSGGHAEAGLDGHGTPGLSFFSPVVLASFVTAFGGFGVLFSDIPATANVWASAPLSMAGACIVAFGVLTVFNAIFSKAQGSSEARVGSAIGQVASLLSPIPKDGMGEIAYVQGSTRYTAPARSEHGEPIAGGEAVRITRVVGTQYFVERLSAAAAPAAAESQPSSRQP